jgi:hypothetical protein
LLRRWSTFRSVHDANIDGVSFGIIVPIVLLFIFIGGGLAVYKRTMQNMAPESTTRHVNGARLTSDRLRALPTPPWRFVFEISEDKLGGVDHVIIGPSGVIAVSTQVLDRPALADHPDPHLVANAALMRGPVDDLAKRAGLSCDILAKVYWGTAQPERPAAIQSMHATLIVEGQRLNDWLLTLPPGPLTPVQIDLAWQAILTGIGRPDPLA